MFDAVRNQKLIVQILLGLIALSFAIWGVGDYVRSPSGGGEVATIGSTKITQQDLQKALRDQVDRMRATLGKDFDPSILDRPEARQAALETVVRQRLVQLAAYDDRLMVTDDQLRETIGSIPALQVEGKFSKERYQEALRGQNLTQTNFEAQLRDDLAVQRLVAAVAESAFVSRAAAARWADMLLQEREISEAVVKPDQFLGQVKIPPAAIKEYYENNRKSFEVPEQLRAQYVVLSQEKLAGQISVGDEEVKDWYSKNTGRFKQPEERRASHILIQVPKGASEEDVKAAQGKIEDILKQVRKNPNDFGKLAKEYSQDPGSAASNGDLGYFGRGAMVKPFEDAVFSLKENQVSDVVRTDFGFHIIKMTGVKAEKTRPLEEMKPQIVAELKNQAAARKFAEIAESFSNTVYEQADSLKPASEKFNLPIQETRFFSRVNRAEAGPLANDRLVAALFAEDAVKNRRNTEAVEVAPNTLVAARVSEYKPATLLPLESVSAQIESKLKSEEAAKLAQKEGEARLAKLQKGESADMSWSAPRTVKRSGGDAGLSRDALSLVFRAPTDKLPSYTGVALPNGAFAIYRITKAEQPRIKENDPGLNGQRVQMAQLTASEDFDAYLAGLRKRFGVKVNPQALAGKEP